MRLLDKLEKIFGRLAVPNLALYIVIGQVFVLLTDLIGVFDARYIMLVPGLAMQGEWWRFATFLFVPPPSNVYFVAFALYLFFLMGRGLEDYWGAFRFNCFIFFAWVLTIAGAAFFPGDIVTNVYILGSVFMAFAYLNPNFELSILGILPVKIKWLALIEGLFYAYTFMTRGWSAKVQILASVVNFALFFGADIVRGLSNRRRASQFKAAREDEQDRPRHECRVCGKTDRTHPQMDFRYCSKCAGDECYCPEHIGNHVHVTTVNELKN